VQKKGPGFLSENVKRKCLSVKKFHHVTSWKHSRSHSCCRRTCFFPKMMKHDVFSLPKILTSRVKSDRKAIKGVFTMGAPGNVFSCFPFYVKKEKGILKLNLPPLFRLFGGIPARRRWEGTSALLSCRQTKKDWHGCLDPLQKKKAYFFFLPPRSGKQCRRPTR